MGLRGSLPRLAAAALCGLAGCHSAPPPQHHTLIVFGSEATLELRGTDAERGAAVVSSLVQRLGEYGRDWHPWEPGALVDLNAALARGEAAPVPASIRDLIRRSQHFAERSDGLFDPAIGGLLALWGFHTDDYPILSAVPDATRLAAWRRSRPSVMQVRVDGEQVSGTNPAVRLDFGAIAEGVAMEEVARLLSDHGIRHALFTLGGDLLALGQADGRAWRVGIRDPYGGVLAGVELDSGEVLFSSGNYNKFREAPSGARWPHVLDPRTGEPVRGSAAVAVLHRDPVLADVTATVLMVAGPARFSEMLQRLGVRCALLVTEENEMLITAAMDARIRLQRDPVRLGPPLGSVVPCTD